MATLIVSCCCICTGNFGGCQTCLFYWRLKASTNRNTQTHSRTHTHRHARTRLPTHTCKLSMYTHTHRHSSVNVFELRLHWTRLTWQMSRTALSSHHSRLTVFAESLAFDDDDYELTSHAHAYERASFVHSLCLQPKCSEREHLRLRRRRVPKAFATILALSAPRQQHLATLLSLLSFSLGAQGTSVCLRFYCFCCCKTMIPPLSRVLSLSVCAAGPKPKVTFVCRRL